MNAQIFVYTPTDDPGPELFEIVIGIVLVTPVVIYLVHLIVKAARVRKEENMNKDAMLPRKRIFLTL